MNNKYISLLILFLLSTLTTMGQTLKGKIIASSSDHFPVAFAKLQLLDNQGQVVATTTSNDKGIFSLAVAKLPLHQVYQLVAKSMGFSPIVQALRLADSDMELGVLQMAPSTQNLSEVTIKGSSHLRADGYTIFPSKHARTQSKTGYDFVRKLMIPDLQVDPLGRKVQTTAGSPVLVLINDKRASVDELLTLRSSRVSKVIYIDAPGAEYGADMPGAVLKVYVTQPQSGWQGGFDIADAVTTMAGENFAFLRYNHKHSEIGLVVENSIVRAQRRSISQLDRYFIDDTKVHTIDKKGDELPLHYDSYKATLHYNHTLPQAHIFNIALSSKWYNSPNRGVAQQLFEEGLPAYRATSNPTEKYLSPELDVFYLQAFGEKATLSYNLHATYINTDYGYSYSEDHPTLGMRTYGYDTKGDKHSLINELRYEQSIRSAQLGLGARYLYSHTKNTYISSIPTTTLLDYHNLYFYAQLVGRHRKLRYNVGIGANMLDSRQGTRTTQSWVLRPQLTLSVPLRSWNLQYAFDISSVAPTLSQLSNVTQRANAWQLQSGNPELKAYHNINNRITVRKQWNSHLMLSGQLGSQYAIHPIVPIIVREQRGGETLFNYNFRNAGHSAQHWGMIGVRWMVIPECLTFTSTLTHRYTLVDNAYFHHHLHNTNLSVNADFTLGQWNIMANYYTASKELSGEIITTSTPNLNVMVRYNIGNWTLGLNATNLFLRYGVRQQETQLNAFHQYNQDLRIPSMANMIGIYVNWNFSSGRKHRGSQSTLHNSDTDSGILKF